MWIKICGIRDVETATEVAQLSPDAVGLNFYPKTPRAVASETAAKIVTSLPHGLEPVGLFVNRTAESIHEICRRCTLRTIQLHGDEPPDVLAKLRGFCEDYRIIRAYRLGPEGFSALAEYLDRCRELDVELSACLIDAHVKVRWFWKDGCVGHSAKTIRPGALAADDTGRRIASRQRGRGNSRSQSLGRGCRQRGRIDAGTEGDLVSRTLYSSGSDGVRIRRLSLQNEKLGDTPRLGGTFRLG